MNLALYLTHFRLNSLSSKNTPKYSFSTIRNFGYIKFIKSSKYKWFNPTNKGRFYDFGISWEYVDLMWIKFHHARTRRTFWPLTTWPTAIDGPWNPDIIEFPPIKPQFHTSSHFSRNFKYFGRFISIKAAVHMDINSHFLDESMFHDVPPFKPSWIIESAVSN